MTIKQTFLGATCVAAFGLVGAASAQDQTFITIGTGGVTGVYYPTGGAICRLVNLKRAEHNIRCSVESTGGSVYNARTVRQGELDFGVVQSDVQQASIDGTGAFEEDGPYEGLRGLFSLHPEPMHLMVRGDAGISSVEDLRGKKVNIGNPGSGTRVLAETVLEYYGISPDEFAVAAELKSSEQSAALCDGNIDATMWAAGLPNGSTQEAASTCDMDLIAFEGEAMDKLLEEIPAYGAATIPGGMYPGNDEDVLSWGPLAAIVTSAETPDDVVYAVVQGVFDNFEDFKRLHPAFARLEKEEMVKNGLPAELHPGAAKYYREQGLIE